jgi:cytochrome bd ubiquinol oxidase subunit II
METLWFILVALMLTTYVILDGFDLGAGAIHLFAARTDDERRSILAAIGPVWDGNEVWLLAAGGTLFFAFPALYASSFSGFYLPLMIVLWLLMLRAIGIEFRARLDSRLWRSFFDAAFSLSSLMLAVFFGAALGNVIRGVPLGADGYFFAPLWTTFTVVPQSGILDWYTVLVGVTALVILASHGALYIALKTQGQVNRRSHRIAAVAWWGCALLTIVGLAAALTVRPQLLDNFERYPAGWILPLAVVAGMLGMATFRARRNERAAFLSSCLYIAAMLGGAAFALYPVLLPASTDAAYSLTIHNAAAQDYGLRVGIIWWAIGITLALGYFTYLFRSFSGKVGGESHTY